MNISRTKTHSSRSSQREHCLPSLFSQGRAAFISASSSSTLETSETTLSIMFYETEVVYSIAADLFLTPTPSPKLSATLQTVHVEMFFTEGLFHRLLLYVI